MRGLRQVVWAVALMAGLAGCATDAYYPEDYGYPEGYASNLFYCPANPYYGFGCPGGFYYNDIFFPNEYAFFSAYHIDRRYWRDFHDRYYWSWDDGIRAGPAEFRQQPNGIQGPIGWSRHFPFAGRPFGGGKGGHFIGPHSFFRHG